MLGSTPPRTSEPQTSPRLVQASQYVSRNWFPTNPKILEKIREKLLRGEYEKNYSELILDLRGDFSLFSHVLRSAQLISKLPTINPLEIISRLDSHELREIFTVSSDDISSHSFNSIEKLQASRLKHLVLSTTTADTLATKLSLDTNTVFCCSLIRQLGLNLIAWNYPSVYTRAISTVRTSSRTLEELLEEALSFSPFILGWEVVYGGSVPPNLRGPLGLSSDYSSSSSLDDEIQKLCEMGEAFAVLNDPENFPAGTRHSALVLDQITGILGPNGISSIVDNVRKNYQSYVELTPELFRGELPFALNRKKAVELSGNILLSKNQYVPRCPEQLQPLFRNVYKLMTPGGISREAIENIVVDLVPKCSFTQGCLFILEPTKMLLKPRLHFGINGKPRFGEIGLNETGSPIVEAFYCSYPIRHERIFIGGEPLSFISGLMGSGKKSGVLLLEFTSEGDSYSNEERLATFKAIRHTLSDALQFQSGGRDI